jgi:hypothetical protein
MGWWNIDFINNETDKTLLEKIRHLCDGCPACMLSAMRLTETESMFHNFIFSHEKEIFWADHEPDEPEYHYY